MNKFDRLKELTILYVEDEEDIVNLIKNILIPRLKKVYIGYNGKEGLDIFKENADIDIIMTDINMPTMNGLEMTREIKKIDKNIPIIITTAFNEVSFLQEAIDLNIDKYIIKPLSVTNIFDAIQKVGEVILQERELKEKDLMLQNNEKIFAMAELLENIAHQWRQPLSVITTYSSTIQMRSELGILDKDFINKASASITKNATNLSLVIDNFSAFFDIRGKVIDMNISNFLKQLLDSTKKSFEDKGIKFILNIQKDINLKISKDHFLQIVFTLVNNSKDILLLNNIENKYIFISLLIKNNKIILEVKDNAKGIKQEHLSKVFEPYFTTKHKAQGTGLGLYMLHKLITHTLKGKINVENQEFEYDGKKHKGAVFQIIL